MHFLSTQRLHSYGQGYDTRKAAIRERREPFCLKCQILNSGGQ